MCFGAPGLGSIRSSFLGHSNVRTCHCTSLRGSSNKERRAGAKEVAVLVTCAGIKPNT